MCILMYNVSTIKKKEGIKMQTLKEIKNYLKELKGEEITSKRGNKYEVKQISKESFEKIKNYKSLPIIQEHNVNGRKLELISWLENKKTFLFLVEVK